MMVKISLFIKIDKLSIGIVLCALTVIIRWCKFNVEKCHKFASDFHLALAKVI